MADWPIQDQHKDYRVRAWIDGNPYDIVEKGFTRRLGLDQSRSSCTILLNEYIELSGNEWGFVDVQMNDVFRRYFTGIVRRNPRKVGTSAGLRYEYQFVDVLALLASNPASTITWANRAFDDAITDILTSAGFTASQIGSIYDPGITNLGTVQTIRLKSRERHDELANELMKYGGTALFADPTGKAHVLNDVGIPQASSSITYAVGRVAPERGCRLVSYERDDISNITSSYTATGDRLKDGSSPNGTFTAAGLDGAHKSGSFRFAQTNAVCQEIAEREVGRMARPRETMTIEAPFHPDLWPGQTVLVRVPSDLDIGFTTATPAYVQSINASAGVMTINLLLSATSVPGDAWSENPDNVDTATGYIPTTRPPTAAFSLTVEKELIDVAGTLTPRLFVECDASASQVTTGTISYSWAVTGATATPASPTTVDPFFQLDTGSPAGVSITLTVSDGTNNDQAVQALDADQVDVLIRKLNTACGTNGHRINLDAEKWLAFTRGGQSCLSVPPFNPGAVLWAGWNDGALYSWGFLQDEPSLIWTEPDNDPIVSIWVNPDKPPDIWLSAGVAAEKLYHSVNNGSSFTLVRNGPTTISDITAPAGSTGYVRITGGNELLHSYDGGATFEAAQTNTSGTAGEAQGNAPWGNAVAYSGTTSTTELIVFDQGYTVDWSAVLTGPTDLTSLTPQLTTPGYIAGDDRGYLYLLTQNGSNFDATDIAQTDASGSVSDLIRDDRFDDIVYGADAGWKTFKIVSESTIYAIDTVASLQIGLGNLGQPISIATVEIVIGTDGVANGGIWHFVPGVGWSLKNSGLPTTAETFYVAVNPNDPDEWLVWVAGGSDIYRTTNSGTTFTGLSITTTTASPQWLAWSDTDSGKWLAVGFSSTYWRGTNGTVNVDQGTMQIDTDGGGAGATGSPFDPFRVVAGDTGRFVVYVQDLPGGSTSGAIGWMQDSSADASEDVFNVYSGNYNLLSYLTGFRGESYIASPGGASQGVLMGNIDGVISRTTDYDSVAMSNPFSTTNYGESVAFVSSSLAIASGTTTSFYEISDPLGAPSIAAVSLSGVTITDTGWCDAWRGGNAAAVRITATGIVAAVYNGATWETVDNTGIAQTLGDHIAVIVR